MTTPNTGPDPDRGDRFDWDAAEADVVDLNAARQRRDRIRPRHGPTVQVPTSPTQYSLPPVARSGCQEQVLKSRPTAVARVTLAPRGDEVLGHGGGHDCPRRAGGGQCRGNEGWRSWRASGRRIVFSSKRAGTC